MNLNVNFHWYSFAVKSYKNFIIYIVFYCFRHLRRHNPQNIDITVLIFCMQPHFTTIHHLWKFHLFSISGTYSKNRGGTPMYGDAQNRPCEVGSKRGIFMCIYVSVWKLSLFCTVVQYTISNKIKIKGKAQSLRLNIKSFLYLILTHIIVYFIMCCFKDTLL